MRRQGRGGSAHAAGTGTRDEVETELVPPICTTVWVSIAHTGLTGGAIAPSAGVRNAAVPPRRGNGGRGWRWDTSYASRRAAPESISNAEVVPGCRAAARVSTTYTTLALRRITARSRMRRDAVAAGRRSGRRCVCRPDNRLTLAGLGAYNLGVLDAESVPGRVATWRIESAYARLAGIGRTAWAIVGRTTLSFLRGAHTHWRIGLSLQTLLKTCRDAQGKQSTRGVEYTGYARGAARVDLRTFVVRMDTVRTLK